ncbi:DUF938 domain-containing protein [Sphingomicrobium sp. XHP0239]|uniref:DUF938 domain-containing protein n=1 Tax=Sphingomicrobium maritimum TaxID=3133972 RepID=UPI0031CC89BF
MSEPYQMDDLGDADRREAPAVARNVGPIGDILAQWLPGEGFVLETSSGTGEHALAFARRFPALTWQPSDPDAAALRSIAAWGREGPDNLRPPLLIDVREKDWGIERADAIVSINMVHIAPWEAALGLLDRAARLLPVGGPLILYGPWYEADRPAAPSNEDFDRSLKARDPDWGIRAVEKFDAAARARGLVRRDRREMPANNLMLLYIKSRA